MQKMQSSKFKKLLVTSQSWRPFLILTLIMALMAACQTQTTAVPTEAAVAEVPSLTPSLTPSPSPDFTATWTPRPSRTPYITPTFVNTAVPPQINTRQAGIILPGGGVVGPGGGSGEIPTVTRAVPRSTQTAAAVTATAIVSATNEAATATQIAGTATAVAASATPFPNNWRGEYFANQTLSGSPTLVRNDANLNFNWGSGSPDTSIPNDNFSARWVRSVNLSSATYMFYVYSDDGVRVYLDDTLILDEWRDAANRVFYSYWTVGSGQHTLRVEYYENDGNAYVGFGWQLANEAAWVGEYYRDRNLTGPPVFVRQDTNIDFDWGSGAPNGLPTDNFSIRWSQQYNFNDAVYEFSAQSDDGIRIFQNNNIVIDEWRDNVGTTTFRRKVSLSGDRTIRVEYYEAEGDASVRVSINGLSGTSTPPLKPTLTPTP